MNAVKRIVTGMMALLCWAGSAASGSKPQAVLDALPTEEAMGPGWAREFVAVQDLGDAAVFRHGKTRRAVWFRRGDFLVWIEPLAHSDNAWEKDGALQRLARLIDRQMKR